jgi:hypothetical protein
MTLICGLSGQTRFPHQHRKSEPISCLHKSDGGTRMTYQALDSEAEDPGKLMSDVGSSC